MSDTFELHDVETDITLNSNIKKLFFNQLKDSDFRCKLLDDDIEVSVNLFLPDNSEYPFSFRIDSSKYIVIPQYTKTHRAYIPSNEEKKILKNIFNESKKILSSNNKKYRELNKPKNSIIGRFSGRKSRLYNNNKITYSLPKYFNDLAEPSFLDDNERVAIKNIYICLGSSTKEEIAFIKIFDSKNYRTLINPKFTDSIKLEVSFSEDNMDIEITLSDKINADEVVLLCD